MSRNIGPVDRVFRAILGVGLIVYVLLVYTTLSLIWTIVLALAGVELIFTTIVSWSPLYALFGIETFDFPGIHRRKVV